MVLANDFFGGGEKGFGRDGIAEKSQRATDADGRWHAGFQMQIACAVFVSGGDKVLQRHTR